MALRSKSFGTMLPRLDFHGSLRDAVLADRKTATTRLSGELDPNSDVDELKPGARCAATCDGETFAELTVEAVEPVAFDALTHELARAEGCRDVAELRTLLKTFYPRAKPGTTFLAIHFRCAASTSTVTRVDAAAAALKVLGLAGDFCSPALAREWPLAALALNANDAHCLLTAPRAALAPWLLVVVGRRAVEDLSCFALGRLRGRRYVDTWLPSGNMSRTAAFGAVLAAPGVATCAIAGAAGLDATLFCVITIFGAALRALAIRALSERVPGLPAALDDWTVRFAVAGVAAALPLFISSLRIDRAQPGHWLGHFPWPWTRARWLLHRLSQNAPEKRD